MLLKKWDQIPESLRNEEVMKYYDILCKKQFSLFIKKVFDIFLSFVFLLVLSPFLLGIAAAIKLDSKGPVFFRQKRITQYGRVFRIFKFRTMVSNAEKLGPQVTVKNDSRVTRIGHFLRKCRLDETPQLLNILFGDMSFVGTRPEASKYVEAYTDEMKATLLMPAGVTSLASIRFKDEEKLLEGKDDIDRIYLEDVLPQKMKFNLEYIKSFGFFYDMKLMIQTFFAVLK